MIIGITMIKVVPGHEKASHDAIREIKGVKEIYHLFGEYNFFLILEALDRTGLSHLLEEIHSKRYVIDIWPLLVSRESCRSVAVGEGMSFTKVGELVAG